MTNQDKITVQMELNLPGNYCEYCPYFDPEILSNNFWANGRIVAGEQKMICKTRCFAVIFMRIWNK